MPQRHLHFVQSIELAQGGGLGKAALDLHREFLRIREGSTLLTTLQGRDMSSVDQVLQFRRKGPSRLFYAPDLARAARELLPSVDVVHGHGFYVYPNFAVGRRARRLKKPLVYHPHGMLEPYILHRARIKKALVHLLFENANFRKARLWRALTLREADQIRACGVKGPIVISPNGVHLDEFDDPDTASLPLPFAPALDGERTLLFLGRMHVKKGLDLLMEAWTRLEPWKRRWRLVIAGPDESGLQQGLEDWAAGLPQGAVLLPGPLFRDYRLAALRSATAFVLPSRSEGFPIALLEAMACRLPVIATHGCNLPEIEQAGAGWLCESDAESIADAIKHLMYASESGIEQRGTAGRRLVEERFEWSRAAEPLLQACRDL